MYTQRITSETLPEVAIRKLVEDGAVLLDVRTHCEYAGYHIEGAINVPYDEICLMQPFLERLEGPLVLYSAHGRRSGIALRKLRDIGLDVYDAGTLHSVERALQRRSPDS
ncbi:MAG: hypothetical protein RLY31_549 [Bacteroidota bacterium]|jgi:rhodanese-related sulfurtransferase